MEQAAQLFTDYYEGEVSVKPSNLRAFILPFDHEGNLIWGIVPDNFTNSPWPVVLLKTTSNQVCTMTLNESARPYTVVSVDILSDPKPMTVNEFMQQQSMADGGYLLIGWVNNDGSLVGMEQHPKNW